MKKLLKSIAHDALIAALGAVLNRIKGLRLTASNDQ